MIANKGIICTKIGCRFDEKHQMRQPLLWFRQYIIMAMSQQTVDK